MMTIKSIMLFFKNFVQLINLELIKQISDNRAMICEVL